MQESVLGFNENPWPPNLLVIWASVYSGPRFNCPPSAAWGLDLGIFEVPPEAIGHKKMRPPHLTASS